MQSNLCRRLASVVLCVAWIAGGAAVALASGPAKSSCRVASLEGDVRAGESFAAPIGGGLEVRLEALSWGSGWLLRILPSRGPLPAHDYAELATPPYSSVSPLLLSTDYSFRAQDAVAWNPRRFRFAANAAAFTQLTRVYERYTQSTPPPPGVESELATLVGTTQEGTLQILDARLVPGTANQAQMAAVVASHFSTTAHTVEESAGGKGSPLGKITWFRFRLSFDLPTGFTAAPGLKIAAGKCP